MKKMISALLLLILVVGLMVSALAVESAGDGSGGGSDEVLALESSSIPDGSTGVALDALMTLTFNKNVVNMSVQDSNMTCFSLADSQGNDVGINVLMGDDQINPDIKRIIEIDPKANLLPDTTYMLTISSKLTSKSGVSLGQAITITFTTVKASISSPSPTVSPVVSPSPVALPSPSVAAVTSPSPSVTDTAELDTAEASPAVDGTLTESTTQTPENTELGMSTSTPEVVIAPAQEAPESNDTLFPWYIPTTLAVVVIVAAVLNRIKKKK